MTEPASTRTLVIERNFPHPPERVWRESALIEEWLMKNDFQPIAGHRFNFRATPIPHWNGVTDCEVLAAEPNKRLSYRWNSSGEEAANGLRTVVTWTLTPTKSGVLVRMEQPGFRAEEEANYRGAWMAKIFRRPRQGRWRPRTSFGRRGVTRRFRPNNCLRQRS